MKNIEISFGDKSITALLDAVSESKGIVIIAHGAGAPMTHLFMSTLAEALNKKGYSVLRFNFPYMDAGKKFTGSPKLNIVAWKTVLEYAMNNFDQSVFISGKSYGGRIASHLLAENPQLSPSGIIYFGFPLHAPGRDSKDRADHLSQLNLSQLFLQGTKDALAKHQLVTQVVKDLPTASLVSIEGGDHSFKVKGQKPEEVIEQLATEVDNWIKRLKS